MSPMEKNKNYIKKKIQCNQDDIKCFINSFDDPTEYFNVEKDVKLSKYI